jgi:hypothetical protein
VTTFRLTAKQRRILAFLSQQTGWVTRKAMEGATGPKGFSKALGAPTRGLLPSSLESLGLVERYDMKAPFSYRITAKGRAALKEATGSGNG